MAAKNSKIELWDGYEVEVNEQLLNDFDYITDLNKAEKDNDLAEMVSLYFAAIGGEKIFNDTREHIIKEKGYFANDSLLDIINKINDQFPKAGKRAPKHYGTISK